ncbi:MAG: putative TIM-barrel fold metal-dependent hydrolase [Pirellulaceae bacterium]|jgi:predicted TIM-barrel fold metal-dependent hydrolase
MHLLRILSTFWFVGLLLVTNILYPQGPSASDDVTTLDGNDGRELLLRNFRPKSELLVPSTKLTAAKFSVVDVHSHFRYRLKHSPDQLKHFVEVMNRNNIAICVSLDGRLGSEFDEHAKYLWTDYPNRFMIFANIDWVGDGDEDEPKTWACHRPDFARHAVEQLREAVKKGACGVKVFKQFGLQYKNPDGSLIKIDDQRFDPIWEACGQLGIPVIIHTADPAAFFRPIDKHNERWEELSRHPDWSFHGDKFPSREELLKARNNLIERHAKTNFIGAHLANNSEDLATVAKWLDQFPNLSVEFASRIGELGRQPYSARRFLEKYNDRVLFGTDGPWPETRIKLYWRFLETYDENFPYSEKEFPPQGLWSIYGVGLSDATLEKIYRGNAQRIIPGLKEKLLKYESQK